MHWDPQPLIDLLIVDMPRREALQRDLPGTATGILDLAPPAGLAPHPRLDSHPRLGPAPLSLPVLGETLLTTFATWEKDLRPRQA